MPSYSDATDETDTLEILCAKINALGSINAEMLDEIVFRMKDNVVSSIEHELTCDFSELDLNDAKRGPFKPWKLETKINDANVSDRLAKWKYSDLFIRIPSIFKGKNRYQISNIIDLVEANKYHIDIVKKNRDILDDDSETCKAFRSILTNLENIQVTIGELHYLVFNVLDSVHANDENDVETSMNQIVSAFQQILIKIPQARLSIKGKHIDTLEKKSNNSIPNVVNSANLICNSALLVKAHSINVIEKFNFQKVPYIASGSDDGMIRIWNMDQKNIDTILSDRKDPINALQYYEQEGESFIASGSADAIRVWNLRKKIITKRFKASATVTDLTLFKRKEQFILASISFETNFIEMWDIENEKLLERLSFPTNGRDGSSTITKYYKDDIPFLIIACYDRTIKIMNVVDDTIVAVLRTKDTVGQFKSLHVLHYLGVSVLISGSNYLHLWDLDLHCIINGVSHVGLVTSVDMIKCNDELCIVTGSTNGNMKIYNMDLAFVRGKQCRIIQQPVLNFALSPARVNPNQAIDYSDAAGAKLFNKATAPLDYVFNVEDGSVQTFIETLNDRATMYGWKIQQADILTVENVDLLQAHGTLTLNQIRDHCTNYIQLQTRQAQNSYQMYACIMASLTDEGRTIILNEANKYTINGIQSGPLLFKVLMPKAAVDTRATVLHIRTALSNIDSYMSLIKGDVDKFNQYVRQIRQDLLARGEQTTDLLGNLFKGYKTYMDKQFTDYIQRKKDLYEEGEAIDEDSLMIDALNKFNNIKKEGQWNALSPEQEKLVTLTAQFEQLKDKNLQLSKKLQGSPKSKSNQFKKKKDKKSEKYKPKNKSKIIDKNDEAWKKVPPTNGTPNTMIKDGETYIWCSEHLT